MTPEKLKTLTIEEIRAAYAASGYNDEDELGRPGLMSATYAGECPTAYKYEVSFESPEEMDFETGMLYVWVDYTPKGMIIKAEF